MKVTEIIEAIERIAPKALAAAWDNSGMQVATRHHEVDCLALCLDPTPASVEHALELKAGMLLSHHPLLMQPRLPSTPDHYHRVLELLFKSDAALYAAHTSLDINPQGPAGWVADLFNLTNREILESTGQMPDASPCGFGLAGTLPVPLTLQETLCVLGKHIDLQCATLCGEAPERVTRLAYCTGSGASMAGAAKDAGAQLFITGDVKYHSALESPLCILDVGHHSLEEEMMRRLALILARELPDLRVEFVPSCSPLRPVNL